MPPTHTSSPGRPITCTGGGVDAISLARSSRPVVGAATAGPGPCTTVAPARRVGERGPQGVEHDQQQRTGPDTDFGVAAAAAVETTCADATRARAAVSATKGVMRFMTSSSVTARRGLR